jgi:uncharacterized protein (DUF58 family)
VVAASDATLFDSAFLAKLEQLHLLARRLFRGEQRAERRSRQAGSSLEFADYREYSEGDELRSIDWPAYGRLERLFVKLYEQEQDLGVSFLVDASASMLWRPDGAAVEGGGKFDTARKITAALAYIALANLDRVSVHFMAERLLSELGVMRGKAQFHSVLDFLRMAPRNAGATSLLGSAKAFLKRTKRSGIVFVLSDFFDPAGYEESLAILQHTRFEVHTIQILEPTELEPVQTGDLRFLETETGASLEVTANEAVLARYRAEIAAFNAGLAAFCKRRSIGHASVTADIPFEDVVLKTLRDGVMLK